MDLVLQHLHQNLLHQPHHLLFLVVDVEPLKVLDDHQLGFVVERLQGVLLLLAEPLDFDAAVEQVLDDLVQLEVFLDVDVDQVDYVFEEVLSLFVVQLDVLVLVKN